MIATGDSASHEAAWRALPWLANGRISQAERDKIEPHVQTCHACREELAFQRLLCNTLTQPDRVTYAPGPSFRKLMDRIDGTPQPRKTRERNNTVVGPPIARKFSKVSLWRPPGLAWAASFVLAIALGGIVTTAYRSSLPLYTTHTDTAVGTSSVLHIAFDRSVTIGAAEEVLRSTGARIVEGPDSTGIFGVTPDNLDAGKSAARMSREMHVLSTRLRADPRVRWVEPIPEENSAGSAQAQTSRGS